MNNITNNVLKLSKDVKNSICIKNNILKDIIEDTNNNIRFTHEYDDLNFIKYKFDDDIITIPSIKDIINKDLNNISDWEGRLDSLINNYLIDGCVYSLGILGYNINDKGLPYVSYGKHILISKSIDIPSLKTYISGEIDNKILSFDSYIDDEDETNRVIVFKCKKIIISNKYNLAISDKNYINNLLTESEIKHNKEILSYNNDRFKKLNIFLNKLPLVAPLTSYLKNDSISIDTNFKYKDGTCGVMYNYKKNIDIFLYNISNNTYNGKVLLNNNLYLNFIDIIIDDNNFSRKIGNNCIYVENGKIKYVDNTINSILIPAKKIDLIEDKKFGTYDFECYLNDNNMFVPYLCCFYTANFYKVYYLSDYNNSEDMIIHFLNDLFNFPNYKFYAHNSSNFDINFILKILYKITKNIKILNKNGKIISVSAVKNIIINGKNKKIIIGFKDSYLFFPYSLDKLIRDYEINTKKLIFPYKFVNCNNLNYIGKIPDLRYFAINKINIDNYFNYINRFQDKNWNLKNEAISYIFNDVKSLFEIIKINFDELYKLESINLNKNVSISSYAMNLFLANYYDPIKTPIHIPHYKQYIDIKKGFYGGRVEVFKCYGENLYWYDVVSLYPAQMKKDMPIGNLIKSNDSNLDNYFGFCYASVDVPEHTYSPVLPFRDDNNNIFYPVGNWDGWYPSVMLKNARDNYGVKVKVHWGYKQEGNDTVFRDFIDRFVELKKNAEIDNNSSRRSRAKLILNSNFGRWGLNYDPYKIKILDSGSAKKIFLKHEVIYHEKFDDENNLEYIKYKTKPLNILKDIDIETYNILKIKDDNKIDFIIRNIPIAAMTTGHASVFMSKILNLKDNPCYYTDTDSCFLPKKLDDEFVGNNLGQLAFKGVVKRGYFIGPKLYCLIMESGDIIIKSKGISSNNLTEQDFVDMSFGICKKIPIERFEKKLLKSSVQFKESFYKINPVLLKRDSIYENGKIINTKPLKVINGVIVYPNTKNNNIYSLTLWNKYKYSLIIWINIINN